MVEIVEREIERGTGRQREYGMYRYGSWIIAGEIPYSEQL